MRASAVSSCARSIALRDGAVKYRLVVFALFAAVSLAFTGCASMSRTWREWAARQDQAARKFVDTSYDSDSSGSAQPTP
jgi:hypothetical protein